MLRAIDEALGSLGFRKMPEDPAHALSAHCHIGSYTASVYIANKIVSACGYRTGFVMWPSTGCSSATVVAEYTSSRMRARCRRLIEHPQHALILLQNTSRHMFATHFPCLFSGCALAARRVLGHAEPAAGNLCCINLRIFSATLPCPGIAHRCPRQPAANGNV